MIEPLIEEVRVALGRRSQGLQIHAKHYSVAAETFLPVFPSKGVVTFIDGGQADLFEAPHLCLSLVRVAAQGFDGLTRKQPLRQSFFVLTTHHGNYYQTRIFGNDLLRIEETSVTVMDSPQQVNAYVRRCGELVMAGQQEGLVCLDGSVTCKFSREQELMDLIGNVCALAKSTTVVTAQGLLPTAILALHQPSGCWYFPVEGSSYVKLHPRARYTFAFDGTLAMASLLLPLSCDGAFLGYPYGLILADKLARVSLKEAQSLRMRFLLDEGLKDLAYLGSVHDILDNL